MPLARRKLTPHKPGTVERKKFAPATFEALAEDLQSGRIPLDRVTVTDTDVTGLRAIIRNTGLVSYHISYDVDGSRPYLKLGDHNPGCPGHMTVEEARKVARTVKALAAKGVDPAAGLHERLVRELLDRGEKWKP
jgi:hypothetical protein